MRERELGDVKSGQLEKATGRHAKNHAPACQQAPTWQNLAAADMSKARVGMPKTRANMLKVRVARQICEKHAPCRNRPVGDNACVFFLSRERRFGTAFCHVGARDPTLPQEIRSLFIKAARVVNAHCVLGLGLLAGSGLRASRALKL